MRQVKVKQYRRMVFDWCNENNIPGRLWSKAWRRFKKVYKRNPEMRDRLVKATNKVMNENFIVSQRR
jgi:hypothetical protein